MSQNKFAIAVHAQKCRSVTINHQHQPPTHATAILQQTTVGVATSQRCDDKMMTALFFLLNFCLIGGDTSVAAAWFPSAPQRIASSVSANTNNPRFLQAQKFSRSLLFRDTSQYSPYASSIVSGIAKSKYTRTILRATKQPFSSSPTSPEQTNEQKHPRKKKKNKYEKFSKVKEELDPMENLIKESERKIEELNQEKKQQSQAKKGHKPYQPEEEQQLSKLHFPDNTNIDPYDPSTFGYIEVGSVVGAHGVHGWIKILSTTDFGTERLCTAGVRHLKPAKKRAPRQVTLVQGKHTHGNEYLIRLKEIDNRDAAHLLRGSVLYVREEEKYDALPQSEENEEDEEYLVSDLVGADVFLIVEDEEMQLFVGKVGGVVFGEDLSGVEGFGQDMLELILPRGEGADGMASFRDELVLIPFVPEIVPIVDVKGSAIYIDPPAGLLDLTYVREEKVRIKGFLPPSSDV